MRGATVAGGLGLTGLVNILANAIGAPWWALVTATMMGILCTTLVGVVHIVIPQESHDKVVFWNRYLLYRERRRTRAIPRDRDYRS
ncbi:hypothetical protein [Actinoplanes sp. NPDC049118]|uniref:hypothetical protein n=1 Tax=Actinoplanes sp. NPDC049118 TaxID=3155769 RepID=UPI0033E05E06